jgi:peptide/nickel transport system permease protein
MGRDLLTRMLYGARVSLVVAVLAQLPGGGVGAAQGLIAGYYGGRLDALIMRVADTTLAFPIILFAILFVVVLGGSLATTVFAVALVLWARYARVIRGEILSLRERDFVAQAREEAVLQEERLPRPGADRQRRKPGDDGGRVNHTWHR